MIQIRPAVHADLAAIMELETHWPEGQRAVQEQFEARLEKFPEGFLLACAENGDLIGSMTACPISYDPGKPDRIGTWSTVTNNGFIRSRDEVPNANTVYLVSAVVHRDYRGRDVFMRMVLAEVEVARANGLQYVAAGAVIPGYHRYVEKHGAISAADYVFTRRGHRLADPFIDQYRRIGFFVPDKRHVLSDYYDDSDSENHAAFVVHRLEDV